MAGFASDKPYASRSGHKLACALDHFQIDVAGRVCADLGCNAGGFTDCLLQRGAALVYAIDTGYGALDYRLRRHEQVVVMERTNALHVRLDQPCDVITIDVAWTRQQYIIPAAVRLAGADADIITLIKPHYEADRAMLHKGVLDPADAETVTNEVCRAMSAWGVAVHGLVESPVVGKAGNREYLAHVRPAGSDAVS